MPPRASLAGTTAAAILLTLLLALCSPDAADAKVCAASRPLHRV